MKATFQEEEDADKHKQIKGLTEKDTQTWQ